MKWKTHRSIGIASYAMLINFFLKSNNIFIVLSMFTFSGYAYVFSTLPDEIDNNNVNLKHRKESHSLFYFSVLFIILTLVYIPIFILLNLNFIHIFYPLLGLFCGYFLHIIADSFTDNGVHLFWFPNKNNKKFLIKRLWYYSESDKYEPSITIVCKIVTVLIWIYLFYHSLNDYLYKFWQTF